MRRRIVVIAVGVEGGDGCAGGGGGGGLGQCGKTEEVRPVKKKFRPDAVQQPTEKETSTVAVFENSKATLIAEPAKDGSSTSLGRSGLFAAVPSVLPQNLVPAGETTPFASASVAPEAATRLPAPSEMDRSSARAPRLSVAMEYASAAVERVRHSRPSLGLSSVC